MYILLMVIIIILSVFLMLVVLVQNPKGGGLGAGFGGGGSANMMGGVKQTTDFLEKATWTLIGAIFFIAIISNAFLPKETVDNGADRTKIETLIDE